jgi:hypothetical protein
MFSDKIDMDSETGETDIFLTYFNQKSNVFPQSGPRLEVIYSHKCLANPVSYAARN